MVAAWPQLASRQRGFGGAPLGKPLEHLFLAFALELGHDAITRAANVTPRVSNSAAMRLAFVVRVKSVLRSVLRILSACSCCGYGLPDLFGMFAVMRGIIFQDAEHTVLLMPNRLKAVEVILGDVANRIQERLPRAVQGP